MAEKRNDKPWDLEERTYLFARDCRALIKRLPRLDANLMDGRQPLRAFGSIGANYIEANDALGKKDFLMKIKISRREAKESRMFLRLLDVDSDASLHADRCQLVQEASELVNILSAMLRPRD